MSTTAIKTVLDLFPEDQGIAWSDAHWRTVCCPKCGFFYVHPENPIIGDDGRSHTIGIPMWCECGAKWTLAFHFAKGNLAACPEDFVACNEPYVYFIEAVGLGRIKIGKDDDPDRELTAMQDGSPILLRLLGKTLGGRSLETRLHREFSNSHIERGWFHASRELRNHIGRLTG